MIYLTTFVTNCLKEEKEKLTDAAKATAETVYSKMTDEMSYTEGKIITEMDPNDSNVLHFMILGQEGMEVMKSRIWEDKFMEVLSKLLPKKLEIVGVCAASEEDKKCKLIVSVKLKWLG